MLACSLDTIWYKSLFLYVLHSPSFSLNGPREVICLHENSIVMTQINTLITQPMLPISTLYPTDTSQLFPLSDFTWPTSFINEMQMIYIYNHYKYNVLLFHKEK